jgi:iron complex outermembrane receptor protein
MRSKALVAALLASVGTVILPAIATAQTAPASIGDAKASATAPNEGTGEILVTANRTASLASKTPITLTAVTGERLVSQGITNPTQLMDVVPNLAIDRGNANGLQINIRGVTSNGATSPSAAFLLDGVYVQQQNAQEVALFDLDRVEVLRGPQGTLYGRNTTAGVVNVISAAPKPVFGASVEGGYGNYGAGNVTAMINVPVTTNWALRLAGNFEIRDSYFHQIVPQNYKNPIDTDNKSLRLSSLFKPSDAIRWLVKLDYSWLGGSGDGFGPDLLISNFYQTPLSVPANGQRGTTPIYLYPSTKDALSKTYANVGPAYAHDSTRGATSDLEWKIANDWTATLLTGYREFRRNDLGGSQVWGDDDNTSPPIHEVYTAQSRQFSRSNSEELRIAYDDGKLKAQAGLYHFYNHDTATLFFTPVGGPAIGLPTPSAWQDSLGAFGQASYSLTSRWRVTGGLRYTRDKVYAHTGFNLAAFGLFNDYYAKGQSSRVTWKAGSDYDITPHVLGYVTVATGYKALGFNGSCNTTDAGCGYKPESLTDYEGGIKGKFFGNTLYITADYFHYDYKNLQISQILSVNGTPSTVTKNASAAKIDGVELEGNYNPTARNRFDFSAAWLNARYENFLILANDPTSGNFSGDKLDHAPTWAFTAGYTYHYPLASGASIEAGIHTRYSGAYRIINTAVNAQFIQPAFTKTDLRVRYTAAGQHWYLEGFVKNIENTVEVTYINSAPGWPDLNNGTLSIGDPRTFGFRAGVKF